MNIIWNEDTESSPLDYEIEVGDMVFSVGIGYDPDGEWMVVFEVRSFNGPEDMEGSALPKKQALEATRENEDYLAEYIHDEWVAEHEQWQERQAGGW